MKNKKYQYLVRWKGFDDYEWLEEKDFVGFSLCEYWKDKVDEAEGMHEGGKGMLERKNEDEGDVDASYTMKKIINHMRLEGVMFYNVAWNDDGVSWITEHCFDNEVLLTSYWKNFYLTLN